MTAGALGGPEEDRARRLRENRHGLVKALVKFTPSVVLDCLVESELVECPRNREDAIGALWLSDFSWATFLGPQREPVDLADVDPGRIRSVTETLRARHPEGVRVTDAEIERAYDDRASRQTVQRAGHRNAPRGDAAPSFAHLLVPARCVRVFMLAGSAREGSSQTPQRRMRIRIPPGVSVRGIDLGGCVFFAGCNDRAASAVVSGNPVLVVLRTDRPVRLRDGGALESVEPWQLARAFKAYNQATSGRQG